MVQLSNVIFAAFVQLALSAQISTGLPTSRPKDADQQMLLDDREEHEPGLFKRVTPMAIPFIVLGSLVGGAAVAEAVAWHINRRRRARARQRPPVLPLHHLQPSVRPGISDDSQSPPPNYEEALRGPAVNSGAQPPAYHSHRPEWNHDVRTHNANPPSYDSVMGTPQSSGPAHVRPRKRSEIAGIVEVKKRSAAHGYSIDDLD